MAFLKRTRSDEVADGELARALNEFGEVCQRRYPALCGPPTPALCAVSDYEACLAYRFASGALAVVRERGEGDGARDDYWRGQLSDLQARMVADVAAEASSLGARIQSALCAQTLAESERDQARVQVERELWASHSEALSGQAARFRGLHDADQSAWLSDRSTLEQELATLREIVRSSDERCSEAASAARADMMASAEFTKSREACHRLDMELAVARERAVSAVATCKSELLLAHG
jgi:hypothetical protein